ncbi:hypothetical protein MVAC_28528 [Mycolicibacterium vaccae ATCC 25954]|uniref:Uncharacterized protein n=1 Tax=Mycolicibacterium vaccae ATCC 25954 TaxID=1194972 RepID=K0UPP7_MYCVA|nr:hypothetical protein MVAC_28528 [Mycolicibacterium vaccae ATCC 25954]
MTLGLGHLLVGGGGGGAGIIPATSWDFSSIDECDADVGTGLLATFDTAVGAEFDSAAMPAAALVVGASGLARSVGFAEGVDGDVGGLLEAWVVAVCVPATDVGPVVWALARAGCSVVMFAGDGGVPASATVGGGVVWFAAPLASDAAVLACVDGS